MRTGRPPEGFIFFARHVMEPSIGCRIWPFMLDQDGYGRFVIGGQERRVNILACEVWYGSRPAENMHAAHRCGNTSCWAGEHLYWATPRENVLDKNGHGTMPRGERHHKARLTADAVLAIRERFAAGGVAKSTLAREYNVTPQSIGAVISRQTWNHI